jgi:hypothetical protein
MRAWIFLGLLAGCGSPEAESPPTWDDVYPILASTCAPCHLGNDEPSAGLSIDRYDQVVGVPQERTGLALVEPFSPEGSYLWLKMVNEQGTVTGGGGLPMPPLGTLDRRDLQLIESWILAGALPGSGDDGSTDRSCPAEPDCADCEVGPASVTHDPWMARLTESPMITWEPVSGAVGYELAVGTEDDPTAIACWTQSDGDDSYRFTSLWGIREGSHYTATVRAIFADDTRSSATASTGWTVDITPPTAPSWVDDQRASVSGEVRWEGTAEDSLSGFDAWEYRLGTGPGAGDVLDWTSSPTLAEADLGEPAAVLPSETWYWLSVRSRDVAGNTSVPAVSEGFIRCPEHFAFVPGDPELSSTPFCVSRYEMKMLGSDDGNGTPSENELPDARPTGTPWATVSKSQARTLCDLMGFSYQLITNNQWQTIARSIERTSENWSGGAVGVGMMNQGHSDRTPAASLASDGDPCSGTGNASCEDPASADWSQKRTHTLANDEEVWDFAGNLTEQVDGSTGGPFTFWTSYADPDFTTEEGWEALREAFAPEGPWDETHGTGKIYGGSGNLTRGGSYNHTNPGTGGSDGILDTGVFQGNHNTWNVTTTEGFRCTYTPM